jgi:hypothetical protein
MDFSFIDNYQETPPTANEAQVSELNDLVNLAQNIPCLHWEYDNVNVPSNGDQLGFITQALKKMPGLASAVSVDENGVENFDSRFVAAAALSLCAALARKVLDIKLREDYADDNLVSEHQQPVESTETNTAV